MTDERAGTDTLTKVDPVRRHTSEDASRAIDRATQERVRAYAEQSDAAIANRIRELEPEWDIERVLEGLLRPNMRFTTPRRTFYERSRPGRRAVCFQMRHVRSCAGGMWDRAGRKRCWR